MNSNVEYPSSTKPFVYVHLFNFNKSYLIHVLLHLWANSLSCTLSFALMAFFVTTNIQNNSNVPNTFISAVIGMEVVQKVRKARLFPSTE